MAPMDAFRAKEREFVNFIHDKLFELTGAHLHVAMVIWDQAPGAADVAYTSNSAKGDAMRVMQAAIKSLADKAPAKAN